MHATVMLTENGSISGSDSDPPPDDAGGGAYVTDKYGYTWMLCT
jgi:hypothetical protein